MKERITFTGMRKDLSTLINRVAFGGEWLIINRYGKDVAMIVPIIQETDSDTDSVNTSVSRAEQYDLQKPHER